MTKPFSVAFKQKMVQRLTGNNAVSASHLARETGVRQQNLSRWLQEARSLPIMADKPKLAVREWTVEQKARVLADASKVTGEELTALSSAKGSSSPNMSSGGLPWTTAEEPRGRAASAFANSSASLRARRRHWPKLRRCSFSKKKWRLSTGRMSTATRTGRTRSDPQTAL
jgi:transposase-like protein